MGDTTVRISSSAHRILREMARAERRPMSALLDEAVETLRRQKFLHDVNASYAALRADPTAWKAIEEERRAWDITLADGLLAGEERASYKTGSRRKRRRPRA